MASHQGSSRRGSAGEVFRVALLLGLTSFGGPIAHLGHFHREYVVRRRWLSEAAYLDLVALCQLLPGPASSQVGIGVGLLRAGWGGALAAWIAFTLPSAIALTALALLTADVDLADAAWVDGLKLAAVAIVGAAVLSLWRSAAPDWTRRAMAVASSAVLLVAGQTALLQVAVIVAGALVGWWLLSATGPATQGDVSSPVSRRTGVAALLLFFVLLAALPMAALLARLEPVEVFEAFYRAGALVFGGGHVVLPLLEESVVAPGWVSEDAFLAGYGAAQAVPGPLFTFAAFLGASLAPDPSGIPGATLAIVAIFLPSFLLVAGLLPFWDGLRRLDAARGALTGTNAAVIGLLVAALYDPVWTNAVAAPTDVALVAVAFGALVGLNAPPWLVVIGLALGVHLSRALALA